MGNGAKLFMAQALADTLARTRTMLSEATRKAEMRLRAFAARCDPDRRQWSEEAKRAAAEGSLGDPAEAIRQWLAERS